MKKISLLIYYVFFIIYEEIVLSCILFKTFPTSILLIMFSIPIAIMLNIISSVFKKKVNSIISYSMSVFIQY